MEQKRSVPSPDLAAATGSDEEAIKEASAFAEQDLDRISKQKEYGRKERFRDQASHGVLVILWLMVIATGLAIIALAWHFLAPAEWHWLNDWQLAAVKAYIFSGAVVAAITGYMRRHLE